MFHPLHSPARPIDVGTLCAGQTVGSVSGYPNRNRGRMRFRREGFVSSHHIWDKSMVNTSSKLAIRWSSLWDLCGFVKCLFGFLTAMDYPRKARQSPVTGMKKARSESFRLGFSVLIPLIGGHRRGEISGCGGTVSNHCSIELRCGTSAASDSAR
jgi:hypothetical protein